MIDWNGIDGVFLDMDGTLLDLNFDAFFWTEHVPRRYAHRYGISFEAARDELFGRYEAVSGTIDWYSVDYWSQELGLDVMLLKEEASHLIAIHPYVPEFLEAVRTSGRNTVLVTNAHNKSLQLKMERTQLGGHFNTIICAHDFGVPKENDHFWMRLQQAQPFDPGRTLFIDDSLPVLRAAREHGIAQLLAVYQPDSHQPAIDVEEFDAIHTFRELLPGLTSIP